MNLIPTLSHEPTMYYFLFFFIVLLSFIFAYKAFSQFGDLNITGKILTLTIPLLYIGFCSYLISYGYWSDEIPIPYPSSKVYEYAYINEAIGFGDELNYLYTVCLVSILALNFKKTQKWFFVEVLINICYNWVSF